MFVEQYEPEDEDVGVEDYVDVLPNCSSIVRKSTMKLEIMRFLLSTGSRPDPIHPPRAVDGG